MFGTGIVIAIRRRLAAIAPNVFAAAPPGAVALPPSPIGVATDAQRGLAGNLRLQSLLFDICERLQPAIFLDIGANDAGASRAVRLRLPNCDIHAFEANPGIHARFLPDLEAARIRFWNLAVSDASGPTKLYAPVTLSRAYSDGRIIPATIKEAPETGKTSLLLRDEEATYQEVHVDATTLDEFAAEHLGAGAARRMVLWIDVEGAADRVIAGAPHVLDQTLAAFVEMEGFQFWKNQSDRSVVLDQLAKKGFVALARDREYADFQHNVLFVHGSILEKVLPLCLDGFSGLCCAPFPSVSRPAVAASSMSADVPVIIPAFNTVTYVRDTVRQLRERGVRRIRIIDNASTYGPMLEYLAAPEDGVEVHRLGSNEGPRHVLLDKRMFDDLPEVFCLTDPDLLFNADMPADFLEQLLDVTERMAVGKAGLALDISEPASMRPESFRIGDKDWKIWNWEAQFWRNPVGATRGGDIAYSASIDTTFALYNKKFFRSEKYWDAIRVGGRFTCKHRPWYTKSELHDEEERFYKKTSKHSYYLQSKPIETKDVS